MRAVYGGYAWFDVFVREHIMNVYDFDKTIYNGDSTVDFYLFSLKKKPLLIRHLPAQAWGVVLYLLGKIDKTKFKEMFFRFVRSIDCEQYVAEFWKRNREKIASWYTEQQREDDVVISASPDFLLRPVCGQLGIRNLIASDVEPKTGKFLSSNCYGATKAERFRETFGECEIESFYSDSLSDYPMARMADRSFLIVKGNVTEWSRETMDEACCKAQKNAGDLRETILYLFFGFCTVGVNVVSYALLYDFLRLSNLWSSSLAWLAAVVFAYITNQKYVFHSTPTSAREYAKEFLNFFTCRTLTGVLDVVIMLLAVDYMHWNDVVWKLISSIIVTVVNYFASKHFVFSKK